MRLWFLRFAPFDSILGVNTQWRELVSDELQPGAVAAGVLAPAEEWYCWAMLLGWSSLPVCVLWPGCGCFVPAGV